VIKNPALPDRQMNLIVMAYQRGAPVVEGASGRYWLGEDQNSLIFQGNIG
jgi:hypothetical protein